MLAHVKTVSSPAPAQTTRESLLLAAEQFFADKGFYGTSIRDVAQAVGISKPSLIHHFPTKERLYSEVLKRIAASLFERLDDATRDGGDERAQLHRFADRMCAWSAAHEIEARILMRELLDNPQRLSEVHTWHLKLLMDKLVSLIESGQASGKFRKIDPLPVMIYLLAGQHYAMIVRPTLERIYGTKASARLELHQVEIVKRMLDAELLPSA